MEPDNNHSLSKSNSGKLCDPSKVLIKYLQKTSVKDLFNDRYEKILFVHTNDLLKVALDKIFAHNIKSVLVFDDEVNAFVASLELSDIQSFLIKQANVNSVLQKYNGMNLADILLHSEFEKFTCGQVSGTYNRNIVPIDLIISLENAINEIVLTDIPRLIAFDQTGVPVGVLSQSRIISSLSPFLINSCFSLQTVADLKLGLKHISIFHDSDTISSVFSHLQHKNLNSVPVVGRDLCLVGTVSTSDLRKIETLEVLAGGVDCELYLKDFLEPTIQKMKQLGVQYPIIATRESTLSEIISNFQQCKIRQIFICEEKIPDGEHFKYRAVIGVITLADILQLVQRFFIDQPPSHRSNSSGRKRSKTKDSPKNSPKSSTKSSSTKKSSKHKESSNRKDPSALTKSI